MEVGEILETTAEGEGPPRVRGSDPGHKSTALRLRGTGSSPVRDSPSLSDPGHQTFSVLVGGESRNTREGQTKEEEPR